GASALITPLVVSARLVRVDVPLLVGTSLAVWLFALDGTISRREGLVLYAGVIAYTALTIVQSRRESAAVRQEYADVHGRGTPRSATDWAVDLGLVAGGLVLLVVGAGWLVDGAVALARWLGITELVIGLTIVAAGTSLPEVAASLVAAVRGERDIAVGNVVGSCLFNLLAVLGAASALAPSGIGVPAAALAFDVPVMVAVAVACLPVLAPLGVARWQGALLLGWYAAYVLYLVLDAQGHEGVDALAAALAWFALPLTAISLGILGWRSLPGSRGPAAS
ncbi:MAG: sodium:calcium antiporter, partial [Vicinamibacterales bacterium]